MGCCGAQRTDENSGWANCAWQNCPYPEFAVVPILAPIPHEKFCYVTKKLIFVLLPLHHFKFTPKPRTQMITYLLVALTLLVSGWQGFSKDRAKA